MPTLQLYLKGAFFFSKEICLSHDEDFEIRVELNKIIINAEKEKMRISYLTQIIKCQYEYYFLLVIQSKMNVYEPEPNLS